MKSYGYFDKNGSEYVVTEVDTKLPLINYFWNDRFISGVSQHMAGIGCFTERTMQYMEPNCRCLMVRDENRHFYLRDDDTGKVWSPGWYPVLEMPDKYMCRHGLGYSVLESELDGISTKLRVFVPLNEPVEIWDITISNNGANKRRVRFYSFVDWLLKGYEEYADYSSALHSEYCSKSNILICYNGASERPHPFFNGFIASDIPPSGFDSSRKAFLGYSQVNMPQAVKEGRCRNSLGVCEKLVGVLEHYRELESGESANLHIIIGMADTLDTAGQICAKLFAPGAIDEELASAVKKITEDYNKVIIHTPDEKLNFLYNNWIKRSIQLHTEVGTDTGKGFRDVMQAAWALPSINPEATRQKIIECLRHQYAEGHTLRGWNPVDIHHYSDGPVWIAPAIDAYLKETGDFGFLDVVVPYFDNGEGTVLQHMLTAIRHSVHDTGSHGLIRAHYGDWNDSLNMMGTGGKGESVWTSIAMVYSINIAVGIAREVLKDEDLANELTKYSVDLAKAINEYGWDGSWYLEGYNDAGEKVGSHEEKEGSIYLNPQTWAIMAGIADKEKIEKIIKAIDNRLDSDYGMLVLTPAYRRPNPGIGRLTWFIPGMWENASSYCHGSAFKIVADTYIKRGNKAYETILKILPDSDANPSSHSGCPPYMVTNMYYGPEHPRKGQILYSWITGTADWLFKAISNHIIGIRPEYGGLLVDPCVPSCWEKFSIEREFMKARYHVEFFNPDRKESGVKRIEVDGRVLQGNLIPAFGDGKLHHVKVYM